MSKGKTILKIVLPLLILAAGAMAMVFMIANRPEPRKEQRETPGALVNTLAVTRGERPVLVSGTGTVQPRKEIGVVPQVSGKIVEIAPDLVAGGFFKKGDLLFRIEDADYNLAVDRARAALARTEYELATVESQARVARQEWKRLNLADGKEPNPLVLYEPQMKNAKAALLSARASLEEAKLQLKRTVVRTPFDGLIRSESLDQGQYVREGTQVAVLAGTNQAEIVIPLPLEDLGWIRTPRPDKRNERGAPATVRIRTGGRTFEWQGNVVRTLGEVDPQGRMIQVVVGVENPYGSSDGRPALAIGSFVQVDIHGESLEDVAVLPAGALRDGGTVWLMNDSRLHIRSVEIVRRTRDEVVIGKGLEEGEQVVLTTLAGAAEGMKLRSAQTESGEIAAGEKK